MWRHDQPHSHVKISVSDPKTTKATIIPASTSDVCTREFPTLLCSAIPMLLDWTVGKKLKQPTTNKEMAENATK